MMYDLPKSVEINGRKYRIHTDFRCILDIFEVLNDVNLTDQERGILALGFFYPEFESMHREDIEDSIKKMFWFIRGGDSRDESSKQPKLVDWEQDFPYIIAPINRIAGHDIRSDEYVHWWTFLAYYMEIGDCTFAQIVKIRNAKAKGKKLDKFDADWYRDNRDIVDMKTKYSKAEDELLKLWGGKNG